MPGRPGEKLEDARSGGAEQAAEDVGLAREVAAGQGVVELRVLLVQLVDGRDLQKFSVFATRPSRMFDQSVGNDGNTRTARYTMEELGVVRRSPTVVGGTGRVQNLYSS